MVTNIKPSEVARWNAVCIQKMSRHPDALVFVTPPAPRTLTLDPFLSGIGSSRILRGTYRPTTPLRKANPFAEALYLAAVLLWESVG
jgi:hypothetical protein